MNINLFEFDDHVIDTAEFDHYLHGEVVKEFEQAICEYVGAKYAASFFSASSKYGGLRKEFAAS